MNTTSSTTISPSLIEKYRQYLPIAENDTIISLGEGSTPLIRLSHLEQTKLQGISVYVKFEGLNPTGSFKDRGMTMAITHAFNEGSKAVICASTGNTSAAAAAYATRADMTPIVLIPEGKIAIGKLAQAMIYGAKILQLKGNFDDAMELVKTLGKNLPLSIVNSINPYRLQGQKTAAFEIIEQLQQVPDFHYLPVGNAGNISAHWMGYKQYQEQHQLNQLPKMVGYQAENSAPFVQGKPVSNPETIATAIRIGNPQSWDLAIECEQQSQGWFNSLSDQQILATQYLLASSEGVFCEPASAASLGGLIMDYQKGLIPQGSTVVCTLTGNGLKDTETAIETAKQHCQIETISTDLKTVSRAIEKFL